jgi:phage baseplate assembly protein W
MAGIQKTQLFVGFSTDGRRASESTIYDEELVKQDLRNHFFTRKGERVMLPEFGSIIWDLLFEPFTDGVIEDIRADAIEIINQEPRVVLQDIDITEFEYGVRMEVKLLYQPFDALGTLELEFDRRLQERGNI